MKDTFWIHVPERIAARKYAGSGSGLADAMREGTAQYDAPLVGAAVVVLAALALALFGAVTLIERLTIPWARRVE